MKLVLVHSQNNLNTALFIIH